MSALDRRSFLRSASSLAAGGALLGVEGLLARDAQAARETNATRVRPDVAGGYGPLSPKPALNNGQVALALPEGFQYTVFGATDSLMKDGNKTPSNHDGMAAFPSPDGRIRLVRNHERKGDPGVGFIGTTSGGAYDRKAMGGTSTLIIDPQTRLLVRDYISVAGTVMNCAGGPTPWGSWISCEETTVGTKAGFDKEHGYCFEVPSLHEGIIAEPIPLKAMGRFIHEALAVDPRTGIVYLTEDRNSAGFYRFIPKKPGHLAEGGRLEIAMVKDKPGYDTRTKQKSGQVYQITWLPIEDPDPKNAEEKELAVYEEGISKGAATFARLEGCWYGHGSIFLDATNGGDKLMGQIFRYDPKGDKEGELTLLFESRDPKVLAMPDNLCVSPRGGLVLCEDSNEDTTFIRGLTPRGELFSLAQNIMPGTEKEEFAGATFSPDGQTLFVNLQIPGLTCAIWGPWERGAL